MPLPFARGSLSESTSHSAAGGRLAARGWRVLGWSLLGWSLLGWSLPAAAQPLGPSARAALLWGPPSLPSAVHGAPARSGLALPAQKRAADDTGDTDDAESRADTRIALGAGVYVVGLVGGAALTRRLYPLPDSLPGYTFRLRDAVGGALVGTALSGTFIHFSGGRRGHYLATVGAGYAAHLVYLAGSACALGVAAGIDRLFGLKRSGLTGAVAWIVFSGLFALPILSSAASESVDAATTPGPRQ